MAVSGDELRKVMGRFATGVTVVTARDEAGRPYGFTANSVTSVSLDPPLVLFCLDKKADGYPVFERCESFAVNILREDQEGFSRRFASKLPDKFVGVSHRPGRTRAPILAESLAYLECRLAAAFPGGDHTIFLGEVEAAEGSEGAPLLFYAGKYRKVEGG